MITVIFPRYSFAYGEAEDSEFFKERLKLGEFDDGLVETLGQLSNEKLQEIADALPRRRALEGKVQLLGARTLW